MPKPLICQNISMAVIKVQIKDKNETVNNSLNLLPNFHWF